MLTEQEAREFLGHAYIATMPCGKVCGMAWDLESEKKWTAAAVAEWIEDGLHVTRIPRCKGDPLPEWSCMTDEECACRQKEKPDAA